MSDENYELQKRVCNEAYAELKRIAEALVNEYINEAETIDPNVFWFNFLMDDKDPASPLSNKSLYLDFALYLRDRNVEAGIAPKHFRSPDDAPQD